MYREVAIDPSCLADFTYYVLIKTEFGFEKGRYVSAVVKRWANEAYPHVKSSDLPPVKKKSVTNFLNKLRKSGDGNIFKLARFRSSIDCDDWMQWWAKQNELSPFSVTLSDQALPSALSYIDVLSNAERWVVAPTELRDRKAEDIVGLIEPLLRVSSRLLIIDQYFSFANNNTLQALLEALGSDRCSIAELQIVTAINTKEPQNVFKNEHQALITTDVKITLTEMPLKFIHDRYFITDAGALKAGQGFKEGAEAGAPSDKVSISFCSTSEVEGTYAALKSGLEKNIIRDVFVWQNA